MVDDAIVHWRHRNDQTTSVVHMVSLIGTYTHTQAIFKQQISFKSVMRYA